MLAPYRDGCPCCDVARAWWRNIDEGVKDAEDRAVANGATPGNVLVSVTINAKDVPTCPEHLEDD